MVILYVLSNGDLWVGNDKNVNWPPLAAAAVKAQFSIDDNPVLQRVGSLSSNFAYTRDNVSEDPNAADSLDAGSGGVKFVDIH